MPTIEGREGPLHSFFEYIVHCTCTCKYMPIMFIDKKTQHVLCTVIILNWIHVRTLHRWEGFYVMWELLDLPALHYGTHDADSI